LLISYPGSFIAHPQVSDWASALQFRVSSEIILISAIGRTGGRRNSSHRTSTGRHSLRENRRGPRHSATAPSRPAEFRLLDLEGRTITYSQVSYRVRIRFPRQQRRSFRPVRHAGRSVRRNVKSWFSKRTASGSPRVATRDGESRNGAGPSIPAIVGIAPRAPSTRPAPRRSLVRRPEDRSGRSPAGGASAGEAIRLVRTRLLFHRFPRADVVARRRRRPAPCVTRGASDGASPPPAAVRPPGQSAIALPATIRGTAERTGTADGQPPHRPYGPSGALGGSRALRCPQRKVPDEKRNADQRPPARGKPHRHR
jgi:hypothetical protein